MCFFDNWKFDSSIDRDPLIYIKGVVLYILVENISNTQSSRFS
jgi:hypothetical protein